MEECLSGLKPIAIEYLYDGMVVMEDIYNYNEKVLLLARGAELTEAKIMHLREFNCNYRNISVYPATYKNLVEHGITMPSILAQEYIEELAGYTEIKQKTENFFTKIAKEKSLSGEDAEKIVDEISMRLHTVDLSLVFQCLNEQKPMNEYLCRHSVNVGLINGLMGKWLNLSEKDIDALILSGLVHDVGKIKILAEILDAPRKLTISEFEVMKMHPLYTYKLLSTDGRFPESVKLAALQHHEKINGTGYPAGMGGDSISLFAKVTAVADIYDAMVSKRTYKEASNPLAVLARMSLIQFSELDIQLVKLFMEHMPSELVGKPVLLSDGSIGTIKYIVPEDLENPIIEVNGVIKKMDVDLYCRTLVSEGGIFEPPC